jgi:MraZ protein
MLLGTFVPKLDEKGRIILPAKFMDDFGGGVVMTRGQERCIYLFSQREFEDLHERARQAPVTGKKGRDFLRLLLSGASQEVPDKQHRVTIPSMLREYAGLDRELTVIGTGNRAEIWDTAAWNAYYEATEAAFADTDEEVIAGLF